jgi:hypothetical protein
MTDNSQEPRPSSFRRGLGAILNDDFSVWSAIGGIRGIIESILPGLIFVIVFVITFNLGLTVIISAAVAVISVVVRLIQRQRLLSALVGLLSIAICLVWAWLSNSARAFYLPGFLVNAFWVVLLVVSLAVHAPGIGFLIEFIRKVPENFSEWLAQWRSHRGLVHSYYEATFVWLGVFVLRLIIQGPVFFLGNVVWLGTLRLVMGVPLYALAVWISWVLIYPQIAKEKALAQAEVQKKSQVADAGPESNEPEQTSPQAEDTHE